MLQEKKISSKINYDVLKSLNVSVESEDKNKPPESTAPQEDSSVTKYIIVLLLFSLMY